MKQYDPAKPLISIHIPKCAGTSFSNILQAWFGEGYLGHYHNEKLDKRPPRYNLYKDPHRKIFIPNICIHGHFNNERGNGTQKYYPRIDQYITVIRDPFELHVSAYFFRKRREKENTGDVYWSGKPHPIIANNWDLEDYLREWKKSYLLSFFPSDISPDNYQQILEQRYLYIGVAEELQASVKNLAKVLGYPNLPVTERNVSEREEAVPEGAREEFIENNPLEMAIYEYALSHFENSSPRLH